MCVSYTIHRITGNVKSKHKQYDHLHSHGAKARERSDRAGEGCGPTVGKFLKICVSKLQNEGMGPCAPYSYASRVTVV